MNRQEAKNKTEHCDKNTHEWYMKPTNKNVLIEQNSLKNGDRQEQINNDGGVHIKQ